MVRWFTWWKTVVPSLANNDCGIWEKQWKVQSQVSWRLVLMTCESEDAPDWQGARAGLEVRTGWWCCCVRQQQRSDRLQCKFLRDLSSERGPSESKDWTTSTSKSPRAKNAGWRPAWRLVPGSGSDDLFWLIKTYTPCWIIALSPQAA